MDTQGTVSTDSSNANVALGISAVAALLFVVAMVVANEGSSEWLWPVAGVLGGVGAFMGWRAGRPRPQGKAMLAVVMGGIVFLFILGWIVWAAATGNFE